MNLPTINHVVFAKAVGIMCLSWLGLPIVYYLLLKKEKKKGMEEENGEEE